MTPRRRGSRPLGVIYWRGIVVLVAATVLIISGVNYFAGIR